MATVLCATLARCAALSPMLATVPGLMAQHEALSRGVQAGRQEHHEPARRLPGLDQLGNALVGVLARGILKAVGHHDQPRAVVRARAPRVKQRQPLGVGAGDSGRAGQGRILNLFWAAAAPGMRPSPGEFFI
jgi:hypothetical protein